MFTIYYDFDGCKHGCFSTFEEAFKACEPERFFGWSHYIVNSDGRTVYHWHY